MNRFWRRLCMLVVSTLMTGALATPALAWDYRIQPGDSLYTIARSNGVSLNELRVANGAWSDLILAGDDLQVPSPSSGANSGSSRAVDLLARLIHAEAGGEPFAGQVAVGAVLMNRLQDPEFPASIEGNVFSPDEFESVSNGYIWTEPTAENYQAAEAAVAGWDPTGGAIFFFNPAKTYSAWMWSKTIVTQIGNHVFAR